MARAGAMAMLLCDAADGRPRAANGAALALLGLEPSGFLALPPAALAPLIVTGNRQFRRPDGSTVDLDVTVEPWHGSAPGCLLVLRPVAAGDRAPDTLDLTEGGHDTITGLPGRRVLLERLDGALRGAEVGSGTVALVFVDLANGSATDQLVPAVAARLRGAVRRADLVARVGRTGFAVVCEHLQGEIEAAGLVAEVVDDLAVPLHIGDEEIVPRFDVGLALAGDPGMSTTELRADPDAATAAAKEQGLARHAAFTAAARTRFRRQAIVARAISDALDAGDFDVHYQPLVDLSTGAVLGVEALARWMPPGAPPVPPDRFIPVAERSGLIVPLGDWVLRTACAFAVERPGLVVAVNISAYQVADDLVRRVVSALDDTGLPADRLRLELTESAVLDDPDTAIGVLRALTLLGIRLSLDDFGTGYSSLLILRRLPFDRLKIDRSFVRSVADTTADREVVAAVLALARAVGVATTAEGVETEDQASVLLELGCEEAQGFLFGRPMSDVNCDLWLAAAR